jgi:beta-lactam-binding protein with PASTA domain
VSLIKRTLLPALANLAAVFAVVSTFGLSLVLTIYFSLRSPEVKVPDVLGKSSTAARSAFEAVGLNVRIRATRYSSEAKADTVLDQSPRGGEVVKVGQTVALVLSRGPKEGEAAASAVQSAADSPAQPDQSVQTKESDAANQNRPRRNLNSNNQNAANKNASARENANAANSNRNANVANRNANSNDKNVVNTNSKNANVTANANRNLNRNANANANARNVNANRNAGPGAANANANRRTLTIPKPAPDQ